MAGGIENSTKRRSLSANFTINSNAKTSENNTFILEKFSESNNPFVTKDSIYGDSLKLYPTFETTKKKIDFNHTNYENTTRKSIFTHYN